MEYSKSFSNPIHGNVKNFLTAGIVFLFIYSDPYY